MASLNITASFFANHVWCVAHTHTRAAAACALVLIDPLHLTAACMPTCRYYGDAHRDIFLGEERASRISPLQSAKSKGVKWGLHSDAPITESDPLKTMWTVRFATPHTTRTDATCHSMACLRHAYVMLMSCLRHASVSIVFVRALLHPSTHDIVVLEFECLSARLFDAGGHAADEERQDARRRSVREPDRGASFIHHRQRIPRIVRRDIYVPVASRQPPPVCSGTRTCCFSPFAVLT
jgi:hypothetical protein